MNGELEERLAALEARVDDLARAPQPDQLGNNFVVVNADGTVSGLFPGGVEMGTKLGATPVQVGAAVSWMDQMPNPSQAYAQLFASRPAFPPNGQDFVQLIAQAFNRSTGAMGPPMLVIDGGGRSNFLRRAGVQGAEQASWGTGTFTFTAATEAAPVTVNHGLANAPVVVLTGSASKFSGVEVTSSTSTQITFGSRQYDSTATTASRAFYWLAIG